MDGLVGFTSDPALVVVLVAVAFLSGVGITTVGPGGIFLTIALYSFTPLPSGVVAGTAHATFVGTGLVGTAAYGRSGEFGTEGSRAVALHLGATSVVGALVGTYVNAYVSRSLFGLLLGGAAVAVGALVLRRERRGLSPLYSVDVTTRTGKLVLAGVGLVLGACSGLLGVGGPVFAVPALVLIGVPMLLAVALAQAQSVFIAAFATAGYVVRGDVSPSLAALVGVPLLAGALVGWRVAHLLDPARLKEALGVVLVVVGLALAL